jgi:hypothetical protein
MIPAHTVFLLQFAKYRPDCARKISGANAKPVEAAPRQASAARPVTPLRRLLELLPVQG